MRTVVALYDRFEDAQQAVQALHDSGFRREDINMVARDIDGNYSRDLNQRQVVDTGQEVSDGAATGAGIGAVLGGLGGLLVGLGALAIPGIGPVIAAGPIITTLAGAGVGAVAGGIVGALVDLGIPEEHAQYYAEGIRRGGTLVVVRADDAQAEMARNVMNRFNPVDIENRVETWRQGHWTGFDQNSQPIGSEQMEFNRSNPMPVTGEDRNRDMNQQPREMKRDNEFATGMDEHTNEDIFSKERAHDEVVDIPVTGSDTMEVDEVDVIDVNPMDTADWNRYDPLFRQDYQTRYGAGQYDYSYYQPAYRYGYDLARDPQYREYDWYQLESIARQNYHMHGIRGAWEDVKDAVYNAWHSVTGHSSGSSNPPIV